MSTEIEKVEPKQFGIEEKKAKEITSGLSTILAEREVLKQKYEDVISLDITEETIPQFRELRLRIRDNRTKGIENWHKVNKAFYLAGGRFVDAIKNKEMAENLRMEAALDKAENHFALLEQERIKKLNEKRIAAVAPFMEDTEGLDLAQMDEDVFEAYLSAKKSKYEAKVAEEKRIEEERLEAERKEKLRWERADAIKHVYQFFDESVKLAELSDKEFKSLLSDLEKKKKAYDKKQAEIAAENERLKKEADKKAEEQRKLDLQRKQRRDLLQPFYVYVRDWDKTINLPAEEFAKELKEIKKTAAIQEKYIAQQKAEKERQEKLLAKEREKRKELEAKEKARKEKERKEAAEAEVERIRLAKAPIKEKLNLWVDSFELPETDVKSPIAGDIQSRFESFKKWAKTQVDQI